MITAPCKNNLLSNNSVQTFKLQLDHALSLNNVKIIARKSDGYINASALCKAGKKLWKNYFQNAKTKAFIEALVLAAGIPAAKLIKLGTGSKNIKNSTRETWVHRKVAIHMAQWISPYFAVKVTDWIEELLITGSVTLGQEKSTKELEDRYMKQLENITKEKNELNQSYLALHKTHQTMLKRRKRDVHEIGNCVYIVSHEAFTEFYGDDYHKIGIATQINKETFPAFTKRLSTYNTGAPGNYTVHYILYVEENKLIEDILKVKYRKHINHGNKEWIKTIKSEDIILFLRNICESLGVNYKEKLYQEIYDDMFEMESDKEESDKEESDKEESDGAKYENILENIRKYDTNELRDFLVEFSLDSMGRKLEKRKKLKEYVEKKLGKTPVQEVNRIYKNNITTITVGMPVQKCCKCKEDRALCDFYKDKTKENGIEVMCKFCRNISRNKNRNRGELKKMFIVKKVSKKVNEGERECISCGKIKDILLFGNNKRYQDGKERKCKICINNIQRINKCTRKAK